ARLRRARRRAVRGRRSDGRPLPAHAGRLACEGAGGAVTDYAAARRTAARPAGARSGVSTALLGVLIVVAAEGTLFGCFIATYYYLRFTSSVWPPPGSPKPAVVVPLILLAVLVATSVPMHLVSAGARAGR